MKSRIGPRVTRREALRLGAFGGLGLAVAACGAGTGPSAAPGPASATPARALNTADSTPEMQALIKKAQAEVGGMNLYTSIAPNVAAALAGAFTQRYGILVNLSRQVTAVNTARITAEAQSGKVVGDIGVVGDIDFTTTAARNGWLVDPTSLKLPAAMAFPQKFVVANAGFTQITATYALAYNTNLVKGNDIPKKWTDVLNAKWKGQIIIPDPRANISTLTWFYLMGKTNGDSFLTGIRDLSPKVVASSVTGLNSVGSGDAAMLLPNNQFVGAPLVAAGAPMADVNLFPTTTYEGFMFIIKGGPHPNTAALFLNYALSEAGQYNQCKDLCSSAIEVAGTVPNPGYAPQAPLVAEATPARARVLGLLGLT